MNNLTSAFAITGLTCMMLAGGSMAAATEPTEPPAVYEVGLYVYKKLDPTLPAAWANSGEQTFITAAPGSDWFTEFPGALPDFVCGPGWAIQQDEIKHGGSFVWPLTITYPENALSKAGVLVDAKHADLESLVAVPDCVTDPEPTPTPTIPPVTPPVLAETGTGSWFWVLVIIGLGLLATGWTAVRSTHDFSTTQPKESKS